jgi:hypothetical protein
MSTRDELLLSFYRLQYDRMASHENARIQVTSFVLTGSVVALGVMTVATSEAQFTLGVLALVIAVNVLAACHVWNTRRWVKIHQARAEIAASALAGQEVHTIKVQADAEFGVGSEGRMRNLLLRSGNLLTAMHSSVALFAIWLIFATR